MNTTAQRPPAQDTSGGAQQRDDAPAAAPSWTLDSGVVVRALGLRDYLPTWRAMQAFADARDAATDDEIWLTEHPPVYTLGLAGRREHLLRDGSIPVLKVDRGGQVTFHGPGQVIAYLLFDLRRHGLGARSMVRCIEQGVIDWLASLGVAAFGEVSAPGVYVHLGDGRKAKLGALGLKIRNGTSYHGVAVNVDMDLAPFNDIDPCGYPGLAVTRLADLGVPMTCAEAGRGLAQCLARALTARVEGQAHNR